MSDNIHEPLSDNKKERRADARHLCHGPVLLFPVAGNRRVSWPAIIRDMSRTGLCLIIDRRFEPGTALRLEWHADPDAVLPPMVGRVVRLVPAPDQRWCHGCSLIGELEVADALDFLATACIDPRMAVDRLKSRDIEMALGYARGSLSFQGTQHDVLASKTEANKAAPATVFQGFFIEARKPPDGVR
jgi:hypothetical protein